MRELAEMMMAVMTKEQKEALLNGEATIEEAVIWFQKLNRETKKSILSGEITL